MLKTDLLIRLRDLHEELMSINIDLSETAPVDDETLELLGNLVTDVSGLVDRAKEISGSGEAVDHEGLMQQIQNLEIEHPKVTQIVSQVTDLLAMMGI